MSYLFHHFHLKPTRCAKGTTESNLQRCPFRNDRVRSFQIIKSIYNVNTILTLLYLFTDFTATDGLCSLLQNSKQRDRVHSQALCALHPKTKAHKGIVIFCPVLLSPLCTLKTLLNETNAFTIPVGSEWMQV